jgi:hypothetical protein
MGHCFARENAGRTWQKYFPAIQKLVDFVDRQQARGLAAWSIGQPVT